MPAEPDWGALAAGRLAALAACSAPGLGVTRLPFTPEHRAALDLLTALRAARRACLAP